MSYASQGRARSLLWALSFFLVPACSSSNFNVGTTDDAASADDTSIVEDSSGVDVTPISDGGRETSPINDGSSKDSSSNDGTTTEASVDAGRDAASDASDTKDTGDGAAPTCSSPTSFPTYDRGCLGDTNCAVAIHQVNCCGTMIATGINHGQKDQFDKDEAAWRATCPACGCPAMPTSLDDGTTVSDPTQIGLKCAGLKCQTYKK